MRGVRPHASTRRISGDVNRARVPGDVLVRPLAVVALMTLIVNDHVLKPRWPGLLTGKLSDLAGLVFLPLLIISLCEVARAAMRRSWRVSERAVIAIVAIVALGFAATKLSTAVAAAYGDVLGWLRWPLIGHRSQVAISHDPTDVLCTPVAIVAWIESRRVMNARTLVIAMMIAVGLAAVIASGSSKPGGNGGGHHTTKTATAHAGGGGSSPSKDVTIVSCTTVNGQPTAKVRIVNHSSKTSSYIVSVAFDSSNGDVHIRSSLSSSSTSNVKPGESVEQTVGVSKSVSGTFTCKVSSVMRFAS